MSNYKDHCNNNNSIYGQRVVLVTFYYWSLYDLTLFRTPNSIALPPQIEYYSTDVWRSSVMLLWQNLHWSDTKKQTRVCDKCEISQQPGFLLCEHTWGIYI